MTVLTPSTGQSKRFSGRFPIHSPEVIARPEHCVSRANISRNALKVLYRLKDAGYAAFLVGGGVRDLLLGHQPKDFDVATDARPEEVRALFSNSRLIGRRFRLAHVRFGREIIEVATFRGSGNGEDDDDHVIHESGRILADNAWGSIEEDALRRDFTINALYYNIADYSIWDFVGGVADVREHTLRMIGDPEQRYREDPVRMLRAARLAAKLDLRIHPDTAAPVPALADLLDDVPPARLFDEFLKLFQTGHAAASFRRLQELGLFEHLFPVCAGQLEADPAFRELIERALASTDERVEQDRPITPMFLFGVFLWRAVQARQAELIEAGDSTPTQAMIAAAAQVSAEQCRRVALPRRFSLPMREMVQMQLRLENRGGRRARRLTEHKRFRAAYDLLVLRAAIGEVENELVAFWDEMQAGQSSEDGEDKPRRRRRRRRRSPRRPRQSPTPAP